MHFSLQAGQHPSATKGDSWVEKQGLSSQRSNTADAHKSRGGFIHPVKAHFDGIKRLQDISACSEKADYQGFVEEHENADRVHHPQSSETRAKNKQKTQKPSREQPGLIS